MFNKILIANRGEIAVRVIQACREIGIRTVAVYSEADRSARHVRLADEAVCLGPAPAAESYLNIPRLVEAAQSTGAEAVHPGYGFLSENEHFAQAVLDAGITMIGPLPDAIRQMGNKAEARSLMQSAGVPVVPGYQGPDDDTSLHHAASQMDYPLLVKAAAGGGGKGMRVVAQPAELDDAIAAARREAMKAFGDQQLLLEKFIPEAHHVEFQVLADSYGNTLHLFERECSVQRRHQKIIEETPSPLLDPALREEMGAAAVTAARSVDYRNAGTIEFIIDPRTRKFYFLEMNTRLQVEHPITELVTGLDLVHWQIKIAAGEALPFQQEDLFQRGHAIECRLYAEDPANGFLPASGKLLQFHEPHGPGIRLDSGYGTSDEITLFYDPLIAKLIVLAEDRSQAIRRMQAALRDTVLLGVPTNWQFLQDVLADPEFKSGQAHTTWVEQRFSGWHAPDCPLPPDVLIGAAVSQLLSASAPGGSPLPPDGSGTPTRQDPYNPWRNANSFRSGE